MTRLNGYRLFWRTTICRCWTKNATINRTKMLYPNHCAIPGNGSRIFYRRRRLLQVPLLQHLPDKTCLRHLPVTNKDNKDLNIWTIRYVGTYLDNYRALSSLADSDTKALPVSLTMQAYKSNPGKQEWLLTLWL